MDILHDHTRTFNRNKPKSSGSWTNCYRLKIDCPICGKRDGCSIRADRGAVYCLRIHSKFQSPGGLYWHALKDGAGDIPPITIETVEMAALADIDRRHAVYSAFLDGLSLLPKHREDLIRRGLDDAAIDASGIKSIPTIVSAVYATEDLAARLDLSNVPGFYSSGGKWGINLSGALTMVGGFYIPIKDYKGRIQALQYRQYETDKGKYRWFSSSTVRAEFKADSDSLSSPGSPAHYVNVAGMRKRKAALITEGALKALVIGHFLNAGVIGFGGLHPPSDFRETLKAELPEVQLLEVAFDSDWQDRAKPNIKQSILKLIADLRGDGYRVNVRTWNPSEGKGLDDVLLSRQLRGVA